MNDYADPNDASTKGISRRKFLGEAATAATVSMISPRLLGATPATGQAESADARLPGSPTKAIHVDAAPDHATNSFSPHRALGTSIDILGYGSVDKLYTPPVIQKSLSAGWGPMTYRQNTELQMAAWHWNPNGTWSDPEHKSGYFTGSAEPTEFLRHSYGYPLPRRGSTRNGGAVHGYSRLTDGDPNSFWKSNPYLTRHFTGEDDALHPQWVVIDLGAQQPVQAIRIDWIDPYATAYEVQYWVGSDDTMDKPTSGVWSTFPKGIVSSGKAGSVTLKLAASPIPARFLRILMTESSNTCGPYGSGDSRHCAGYAIKEVYAGTFSNDGDLIDLIQHSPDQNQTATYCSSIDPWHSEADLNVHAGDQTGFDLFFTSGVTNHLPAIVPIAMLYGTPEDAAAEIAYLKKRGYPVAYVEMGEEPDGQYFMPEDYGALYLQFATAIHRLVPDAKLGGPIFQGVNEDIKVWPDAQGRTSWLGRFLDYLKSHGRISDQAFMSFEHYPFEPCAVTWSDLYREPELVTHMLQVWKDDGLPENVPMLITESNLSWNLNQSFVDMFGALWLAEYAGAFLTAGGAAIYYFQFFPMPLSHGCHGWGTFGMFNADEKYQVSQDTSQYFAARLINLEWVKPGDETHHTHRAWSDLSDGAGHDLLAVYAVHRPDDLWALMIVNRDQENSHTVSVVFQGLGENANGFFAAPVTMVTFGREQYQWHSDDKNSKAQPDGPPVTSTLPGGPNATFTLPKASLTVLRGKVG
jgi:F5/8 type C domain